MGGRGGGFLSTCVNADCIQEKFTEFQCYLLVLPAVGDKGVVLHLHGEVQPGEGVTQSHPERRGIAGHRRHGSHFLPVPSSTLREGQKWCQCETGHEITTRKEGKKGLRTC